MRKLGIILVYAILALIVGYNTKHLIMNFRDPYILKTASAVDDKVIQGGVLKVNNTYDHIYYCETWLRQFIVRYNADGDEEIVSRKSVEGGATGLGTDKKVVVWVALPLELEPGKYAFRSRVDACGHQQSYPDVVFEII